MVAGLPPKVVFCLHTWQIVFLWPSWWCPTRCPRNWCQVLESWDHPSSSLQKDRGGYIIFVGIIWPNLFIFVHFAFQFLSVTTHSTPTVLLPTTVLSRASRGSLSHVPSLRWVPRWQIQASFMVGWARDAWRNTMSVQGCLRMGIKLRKVIMLQ